MTGWCQVGTRRSHWDKPKTTSNKLKQTQLKMLKILKPTTRTQIKTIHTTNVSLNKPDKCKQTHKKYDSNKRKLKQTKSNAGGLHLKSTSGPTGFLVSVRGAYQTNQKTNSHKLNSNKLNQTQTNAGKIKGGLHLKSTSGLTSFLVSVMWGRTGCGRWCCAA